VAEPRGLFAGVGKGNDLGQHRVVIRCDAAACAHAAVDAYTVAGGLGVADDGTDLGGEAGGRVFGADPRLDRPAAPAQVLLLERERSAGRDAQLPFDQVDAHRGPVTGARPAAGCSSQESVAAARVVMNSIVPVLS
jgi:hypothetical protein